MNRTILAVMFGSLVAIAGSMAHAAVNDVDKAFAPMAVQAGMVEVQDAQLATTKSNNPDITRFAQRMIKDHSSASQDLKTVLASRKELSQPSQPDTGQKSQQSRLEDLTGKAFEQAYVQRQVQMHNEAVKAFEHEAEAGADLELRAFATKHLPMMREHLEMARAIKIGD
jgi:putative membrane protein